MANLNDTQLKALTFIDQTFWETGHLPTNEKIAEVCNVKPDTVKKWWNNDTFKSTLVARGIDFMPDTSTEVLDPKQAVVANMLLNLHDKRSIREKLSSVGITTQQYNAWLRQDAFKKYLLKRAEYLHQSTDIDAYLGLAEAVQDGDLQAIKFHFEMRGIYNPKVQVDVNVNVILSRIVEIISKHVRDPETLQAIATEVEMLELGEAPPVAHKSPRVELPESVVGL